MRRYAARLLLWLIAGCANEATLSDRIDFCCGPKGASFDSYRVSMTSVPGFLVAPLREELIAALNAKGWRESADHPDVLVTLNFAAVYPDSGRPLANDGFADPLSNGGPRKFDATVTLDIRRASDDAEVLRGTLTREHTESVGEYDHRRARSAIRDGFDHLLKRLPHA